MIDGKIYKIICSDGFFYIGSTVKPLLTRLSNHKYSSKKHSNWKLYSHILKLGWNAVCIKLLEEYQCDDLQALRIKEDGYIRSAKDDLLCLNTIHSYNSLEQRKQHWRKNSHDYYINNKEEVLKKSKAKYAQKKLTHIANSFASTLLAGPPITAL
jgi:predicted GIY-YIG superfamily endonuclease